MLKKSLYLLLIGVLAGLVASGCVIKDDDPCDGVSCDGHGVCTEWEGEALCDCESGYVTSADGMHCEFAGYVVSLTWDFDGVGCTAAQVASVDVTLLEGATELANATITCAQGDGADIADIVDGSYTVELRATSNTGEMTYYGEGSVAVSGQDASLNITLDPVGFVAFTWDFDGLTCTTAGVSRVKVMINTEDASTNLYTASPVPSCDVGGHSTETDAFLYLGNYNLVLEGVCDSDLSTGYTYDAIMMVTEKGENNYGLLSLTGNGCP
jgi:hypothetical protein